MQYPIKVLACMLLSLCWFIPKQANAQTILLDPYELYVGASGGATGSMVFFNPMVSQGFLIGKNAGISFRYVTEKSYGLQLELNYSERGWSELDENYARQLNYIEVPFLTHIYAGKKNRFIFNLGPKLSYLLSEQVLINNKENSTADQHILPVHNKFDYGIAAGLGYNLKLPRAGVYQFEVRGYYGLADVMPNLKSDYFNNSNHINVSASVGYYFQVKGKESKEAVAFDREMLKVEKLNKKQLKKIAKQTKKDAKKDKKVAKHSKKRNEKEPLIEEESKLDQPEASEKIELNSEELNVVDDEKEIEVENENEELLPAYLTHAINNRTN